jgi:putative spermidine/putrescine transport system ATP-binding protein
MRGNDGAAVPGEGETVRLRFSAGDAAVLPSGAAA